MYSILKNVKISLKYALSYVCVMSNEKSLFFINEFKLNCYFLLVLMFYYMLYIPNYIIHI